MRNILFSLIVLWTSFVAGCASRSSGRTEVVFWAFGAEGEHAARLMPGFERRNPGISVRVQMIPWNAAHEKLLTAFAGRSLPDLCQLGNTWVPEFKTLNAIENLGPWVLKSASVRDSNYFPGIWDTNIVDSTLYGIPWYVDTRVLFYRTDLCARAGYAHPPRSWEEWSDLCRKLKKHSPENYGVFFSTKKKKEGGGGSVVSVVSRARPTD